MIKNGKLFGKINLIDFLVLLVALLAVAAVLVFIFKPASAGDTLIMKFRIEEVDEFVAGKVKVGDALYDDTYSLDLGYVTDIEIGNSISYGGVTDGTYTLTSKEGYYSMIITGEVQGSKTKLGAEIGGKKYGVGHSFVLRAGDAKLYLRVYDIELKDENAENRNEQEVNAAELTEVTLEMYTPEIETYIAETVKVGSNAANADRNFDIGKVTNVEIGPSKTYLETENGIILTTKEEYSSLRVTCSAMGEITEEGVIINGRKFCIGDTFMLRAGSTKIYAKVSYVG